MRLFLLLVVPGSCSPFLRGLVHGGAFPTPLVRSLAIRASPSQCAPPEVRAFMSVWAATLPASREATLASTPLNTPARAPGHPWSLPTARARPGAPARSCLRC
eukprot:scaffold15005_cov112-Isochrysis_galbana.AAC.7